jgi:two-component system phosphate regulon sensor histidine kinase PhoR
VIFNLFDNALKYGGADPAIEVTLSTGQEQLQFSVKDNGIGISPVYKEKIFDKFFRVPSGDKHNVKGYGLGLSYASYVVQRHGGRITVESRLAAGSCFTVKIPRNHV